MNSNRRSFLKRNVVLGGGLLLAGSLDTLGNVTQKINTLSSGTKNINIRYTNDLCGQTEAVLKDLGGLNAIEASLKNQEERALFFDAGGFINPSQSFKKQLKGIDVMNKLNYHAVNVSKAELAGGINQLIKLVPYLNFPLVSANYHFDAPLLNHAVAPFITFKHGKFKIGVTGVGADVKIEGLTVSNPHTALKKVSNLLKETHQCDFIICLTHLGVDGDSEFHNKSLTEQSAQVDLFIGGQQAGQIKGLIVVKNSTNHDTFLSNNHPNGLALSHITFSFNENAEKIGVVLEQEIPSLFKQTSLAKMKDFNMHNNTI